MTADLVADVDSLFRQQLESWPLLARGVDSLSRAETRRVTVCGSEVFLRHIPHRAGSTTAAVDRESIRKRPCFLCPENLFPEQRGVRFGTDFTLYCNPFPVVRHHLTVVHREHREQRIEGQIGPMLDLAARLPGYFVLYNGPQCGASAPDHLHLQAGLLEELPIATDAASGVGPVLERHGIRALRFRGSDPSALTDLTARAFSLLSSRTGKVPEPWVNVVLFSEGGRGSTVIVFPRGQHRPAAYHSGQLMVSPASIDMCGLLITPSAENFETLTAQEIAGIYGEVTVPREPFGEVVSALENAP